MKTKIKDPIAFQKLIQYYTHDANLCKSKGQILAEMADLLKITQFLSAKIPYRIKSIRTKMAESTKNLRKIREQMQVVLDQVNDPSRINKLSLNPNLAYDLFCRFSHEREEVDFKQNFAEKEMKLKFLQSRGLPKKLCWKNIYNQKRGVLIIASKKHQIFIGLGLNPDQTQYYWNLIKIQELNQKRQIQSLKLYFNQQIRPMLAKKYPDGYEDYSLKHMISLLQFAQLIQVQRFFRQQTKTTGSESNFCNFKIKDVEYKIQFSSPESDQKAIIRLQVIGIQKFKIQICFQMKVTTAKIYHNETYFICENFQLMNLSSFIYQMPILLELLQRKNKGEKYHNHFFHEFQKYICIKWYGHTWKNQHYQIITLSLDIKTLQDGIYITKIYKNKLIILSVSKKGRVTSSNISEQFIRLLIQKVPHKSNQFSQLFFTFLYLVEYFQEDSQLVDNFHMVQYKITQNPHQKREDLTFKRPEQPSQDYKLEIRYKKKSVWEEWMAKSYIKEFYIDPYGILILTIKAEFDLNFTSMKLIAQGKQCYINLIDLYKIPEYLDMIENKIPSEQINVDICIKQLNSLRSNIVLKRIIEFKRNSESKASLSINL